MKRLQKAGLNAVCVALLLTALSTPGFGMISGLVRANYNHQKVDWTNIQWASVASFLTALAMSIGSL